VPVTKGNLCPLPKRVFHVVHGHSRKKKRCQCSLIHFSCCAWSLIEDLPKVSNIIAFSFFVTLRCFLHCLHFYLISWIESIPKLYSIAQCTKFHFQQVFICPNWTPNKRVTSVLLWRWNQSRNFRTCNAQCFLHNSLHGSSNSFVLDVLQWKLNGASEYLIFFICTHMNNLSNWWRQQHPSRDSERLMIYLATLYTWLLFSLFKPYLHG
jgi:hypothetical protein